MSASRRMGVSASGEVRLLFDTAIVIMRSRRRIDPYESRYGRFTASPARTALKNSQLTCGDITIICETVHKLAFGAPRHGKNEGEMLVKRIGMSGTTSKADVPVGPNQDNCGRFSLVKRVDCTI